MIEPALTRLQWREVSQGAAAVSFSVWGQSVEIPHEARHATAALVLHGQPFGFTWDDVDALETEASALADGEDADPYTYQASGRLLSLADRIAALLPPRA